MSLILREWAVFNPMYEIRSFVCDRKLRAASQYQEDTRVEWMIENQKLIENKLEEFFYSRVQKTLKMNHAVIDFAIVTEIEDARTMKEVIKDIFVIELNSFGFRTGSNLFDWDNEDDYHQMVNGPYSFRVQQE